MRVLVRRLAKVWLSLTEVRFVLLFGGAEIVEMQTASDNEKFASYTCC